MMGFDGAGAEAKASSGNTTGASATTNGDAGWAMGLGSTGAGGFTGGLGGGGVGVADFGTGGDTTADGAMK
jgi:hypothetical protein